MKYKRFVLCGLIAGVAFNAYAQSSSADAEILDSSSVVYSEVSKPTQVSKITSTSGDTPVLSETEDKQPSPDELQQKADTGDVRAQSDLAYMYLYGLNGLKTDYKKALHYYQLAAEKDDPEALNNLGSLYFNGLGTAVDYAKAIEYFDKATRLGSNDAAVNLAIIYLGSDPSTKKQADFEKIYKLLKQAEPTNNTAKFLIGYSYYQGFLLKQDYKKAFLLIKTVADAQYDEAQYVLANLYINGYGVPKNYTRAVEYLEKSANQGYPAAILELARILEEGKIYPKNIKRAYSLYNVATTMEVEGAAAKRDELEKSLNLNDLLSTQNEAEKYAPSPSPLTSFIRQTFGNSLKIYIDTNMDADFDVISD